MYDMITVASADPYVSRGRHRAGDLAMHLAAKCCFPQGWRLYSQRHSITAL